MDVFGRCDCGRHGCELERALRVAAADACLKAVQEEYGESSPSDLHLSTFSSNEWVCRAFPSRCDRPCPGCQYTPSSMPAWVQHGVRFALNGRSYRVVSVGGTNKFSPKQLHFEDLVIAELTVEKWSLPSLPATTADVGRSLDILFKALPRFRPSEMEKALHDAKNEDRAIMESR